MRWIRKLDVALKAVPNSEGRGRGLPTQYETTLAAEHDMLAWCLSSDDSGMEDMPLAVTQRRSQLKAAFSQPTATQTFDYLIQISPYIEHMTVAMSRQYIYIDTILSKVANSLCKPIKMLGFI